MTDNPFHRLREPVGPAPPHRWIDGLWLVGLALLSLLVFTANLGGVALRDWDEGIVAQVAREIWRSQTGSITAITPLPNGSLTWLYPTVAGEPYLNKPTLVHSLIAQAYRLWGVNEWSARLPAAILSSFSVPMLYGIGRELFPRRTPALFSAAVLLTLLPVVRHGRLAMLDGVLLLFALVMVYCLLRARRDLRWGVGVGLGFGLMCLTKGAVGILLGAIALGFILWDTPRLLRSRYLWLGVLLGSAPVATWYWAQWHKYGAAFFSINLINQSFSRVWTSVESNGGPIWYYLLEIAKSTLPWLIFLPQSLRLAWANRSLGWAKLVLVWCAGYLLVISLMQTKLPWYVIPVYPALAIALGTFCSTQWDLADLTGLPKKNSVRPYPAAWRWLFGILAIAAWGITVLLSGVFPTMGLLQGIGLASFMQPAGCLVFFIVALTLTATLGLMLRRNSQFVLVLLWGCYVSLMALMVSPNWLWELQHDYPVKPVAALIQSQVPPGRPIITSHPHSRPSLNFYSDRVVISAVEYYQTKQQALTPAQAISRYWQETSEPYILSDQPTLEAAKLPNQQTLGKAEGFVLLTHSR
jgi:4-amino-4-deoxy-L-arabinose transferase-like glycosyltransferase